MRLDKYLKVSRLIKRRTVSNEACDGGRVTVNGKVARASYDVKVGDVIALHFGERVLAVEVLNVSETAGKSYIATKLTVQAQKLMFGTEEFENQWAL